MEEKLNAMLEKLFDNPGSKIKSYAKNSYFIEVAIFILTGLFCLYEEAWLWGIILILVGIPASYIANLFLMAFGDLVETSSDNKGINAQILAKLNEKPATPVVPVPASTVIDGPTSVYIPKAEKQQSTPVNALTNNPSSRSVQKEEKQPADSKDNRPTMFEIKPLPEQQTCQAVLSYALKFSTTVGTRSHIERKLKTCDNQADVAVYQAILANSDENLRAAIEKYLNA